MITLGRKDIFGGDTSLGYYRIQLSDGRILIINNIKGEGKLERSVTISGVGANGEELWTAFRGTFKSSNKRLFVDWVNRKINYGYEDGLVDKVKHVCRELTKHSYTAVEGTFYEAWEQGRSYVHLSLISIHKTLNLEVDKSDTIKYTYSISYRGVEGKININNIEFLSEVALDMQKYETLPTVKKIFSEIGEIT